MAGRLTGKTCLVTGAGQGIGRAIVGKFVTEGATVLAVDLSARAFDDLPAQAVPIQLDVTNATGISDLVRRYPHVDVVVNCAGYVAVGDVLECEPEDFARSLRVNLESIYLMTRAVLPGMRTRRSGVIINIASVVSTTMAARRRFVYAATKGAVLAMTRSIALDFVSDGIRCNSISPGTVDSPSLAQRLAASGDPEQARRDLVARQPMGRLGQPADIADAAVLIASDESTFMTGADIVIDGGISL